MKNSSKNNYDKMLNAPIERLLISLSIPTILSMMVTNIYNVADTAFVGQLGTSASGAVGIVFGFMAILQAIGFTFGQGAGSHISRNLGDRRADSASRIASTAFLFSFAVGALVALICYFTLDDLIMFLGSTETIAPYARTYIIYILSTAPFMVSSFTLNNILRYEGKAFYGMIGLLAGALINILGDLVFMFVLNMGIAGAGLSTALSQVISFICLLWAFISGKTQCKLRPENVRYDFKEIMDIIATGMPSLLRQGLGSLTTIMLNTEAAVYGDAGVAGMSIVSRLFFFVFSIAVGVGQGFQPICGFSYGAKKYGRLRKGFKTSIIFSEVLMIVFGSICFVNAPFFTALLRDDPDVIAVAVRALRLQCVALLFLPLAMMTEMLLQVTGKKLQAVVLSTLRNGLIFIPILYIMARLRGLAGIQEAQPLAYVFSFVPAVVCAYRFFKALPEDMETDSNI